MPLLLSRREKRYSRILGLQMKSERSRLEVEMDSIEQIVDVTEYDSLLDAIADVLDSKNWRLSAPLASPVTTFL